MIRLCFAVGDKYRRAVIAYPTGNKGKGQHCANTLPNVACNHDIHVVNLTPSVTLLTEINAIPDGNGELPSFYKGELPLS
jgi:hypothetical protein